MNNQERHLHQRAISIYLMILGTALILAGVGAFFLFSGLNGNANAKSPLSTIPAEVNYQAPELSLNNLRGEPVSLAALRGRVVLVNLWATWCPPCKQEMPTLQAYYDAHRDQGFVIVAINDGDPEPDVKQFVQDYRLSFPVWLDPEYVATEQAFKTPNLPSSFVIDRDGIIKLRWVGEITSAMLEKYVTPIIREEKWMSN
jgi:thiol-disulfide isomerase/thioredoxin